MFKTDAKPESSDPENIIDGPKNVRNGELPPKFSILVPAPFFDRGKASLSFCDI